MPESSTKEVVGLNISRDQLSATSCEQTQSSRTNLFAVTLDGRWYCGTAAVVLTQAVNA